MCIDYGFINWQIALTRKKLGIGKTNQNSESFEFAFLVREKKLYEVLGKIFFCYVERYNATSLICLNDLKRPKYSLYEFEFTRSTLKYTLNRIEIIIDHFFCDELF